MVVAATLVPGSFSIVKPENVYEDVSYSSLDIDERVCGMVSVESNREQEPTIHIQSISDLAFLALRHSHWITLIRALMAKMTAAGKQYEDAAKKRSKKKSNWPAV